MNKTRNIVLAIVGIGICCMTSIALLYRQEILNLLLQQSLVNTLSPIIFLIVNTGIIIAAIEISIQSNTDYDERIQFIRNKASFETVKYFIISLICMPGFISYFGWTPMYYSFNLLCFLAILIIGFLYLLFFTYYYLKLT